MAAFPPLNQLCGNHGPVYEAYYRQVDPKGTGSVGALDAAAFMKKSGLNQVVLSKIWDMSDPTGRGYLEKPGFFVALKLIALAQASQDLNIGKLTMDTPQPNLGPYEIIEESPAAAGAAWDVTPSEKAKYDQVFNSLGPMNDMLGGDKVKPVLLNSKLPMEVLGRIWELSDVDKDGFLDRDEFAVAMHLVYRAREGDQTPMALPRSLVPPSKRKAGPALAGAVPVLPSIPPASAVAMAAGDRSTPTFSAADPASVGAPWVVAPAEKTTADVLFRQLDLDQDGFVTGPEIREVLAKSGLPNTVLAHIWTLCDISGLGKLNPEQFALAMHLIQQRVKGVEVPPQLMPEMIPPSMRTQSGVDPAAFGVRDATNAGPYSHVADFSAIKELDSISKDIDDIKKEKLQIEREKLQYDADVRLRQGEVNLLQKELDAMTGTLTQLESQKKEAQKRLDELDDKKSNLDRNLKELRDKTSSEQMEVNKLKSQISNQERLVQNQEGELEKLRQELQKLRDEEQGLEQQVESSRQQMSLLSGSHKDVTIQVTQIQKQVQTLQDQHRALSGGDPPGFSLTQLNGNPALSDIDKMSTRAMQGSPNSTISSFSVGSTIDSFKEDPFKEADPFGGADSVAADPFQNEDPFKDNDPFKADDSFPTDPFASEDMFKDAFSSSTAGATDDPFGNSDPFASAFPSSNPSQNDGFDAFGSSWPPSNSSHEAPVGEGFGSDPFAPSSTSSTSRSSSVPPPRPASSPVPNLPPKQNKRQPPPRPAPPKSKSPAPNKPKADPFGDFGSDPFSGSDPFASGGKGASNNSTFDAFANFNDNFGKRSAVSKMVACNIM
ncbi:epidermal growth factor receptor substrate 15-like 1 isoform X2 [Littorina saxatilis]|uniref:epidermal growth factor receptor substrate 15-like 1 isoform X2 n=1 Tax=Littorina saxatilis TaxID=31220 RepID=UPI0038B5814B